MKLFLSMVTFFFTFTFLTVKDDHFNAFMAEVNDGYNVYEVLENPNNVNEYYEVKIVKGIYNNEPCYGIAFVSENAKEYKIVIEKQDVLYELISNERGDSKVVAIKADSLIKIYIVDKNGNEQSFAGENSLMKFTSKDFDNNPNAIMGNNNGKKFTELPLYASKIPYYFAFIYSAVIIIIISAIILLIIALRKKGMFNKKVRSAGIVDIEELINEAKQKEEVDLWEGYKPNKEEIIIDAIVEEEQDTVDVANYLQSKGYLTDYNLMSEEEKNNVMVELMMLKNSKKISEDTYYEETYKLWKK